VFTFVNSLARKKVVKLDYKFHMLFNISKANFNFIFFDRVISIEK